MSVADPHVERCLGALRQRSEQLGRLIGGLSEAEWQAETNCPPWQVHDLAAHLVASGQGFIGSIERGLAGSVEPPSPRPHADEKTPEPAAVATALGDVTDRFEALYTGRTEAELETICWHRRGNRSMRWYAAHRLAEVAFHGWDLETSLGRSPVFDDAIAALLLPTLLESNVPRTYAAGLSAERGAGERYLLRVRDDPALKWLVTIEPEVLRVERGADSRLCQGDGVLVVTAPAGELALLVYGRVELDSLGDVTGERAFEERFARIFPRP